MATTAFDGAVREVTNNIRRAQRSPETLKTYSETGLRLSSCEILRQHIEENRDSLVSLFREADGIRELIEVVVGGCLLVREMQSDREAAGNPIELVQQWMAGTDVSEIWQTNGAVGSSEDLAKFLEDLCGYRLPWGVSAYTRLAMALLGLAEADVTSTVRFLPAMIKWGVPIPEAAWAMAAGVPFRSAAIGIATKYLGEETLPSFRGFREWPAGINVSDLTTEYGFAGLVLQDVARAIGQVGPGKLVRETHELRRALPLETELVGTTNAPVQLRNAALAGDQIGELVRDYDNTVDRNAVIVQIGATPVGYLPRYVAQLLAPELDVGANISAQLLRPKNRRSGSPTVRLDLLGYK